MSSSSISANSASSIFSSTFSNEEADISSSKSLFFPESSLESQSMRTSDFISRMHFLKACMLNKKYCLACGEIIMHEMPKPLNQHFSAHSDCQEGARQMLKETNSDLIECIYRICHEELNNYG